MIKDFDLERIKYNYISVQDFILYLDRLTRFKYPEIKYYRVFSDLLCKYLLAPKLSKIEIANLDPSTVSVLVEKIWNDSVLHHSPSSSIDLRLNSLLINDDATIFSFTEPVRTLVSTKININGVLEMIDDTINLPLNLKRLIVFYKNSSDSIGLRNSFSLHYPVEKIVLCEGATEEILLPKFAEILGYNFDNYGVHIISAGGKNKVSKLYAEFKQTLKIPIFVLLDADAIEIADILKPMIRSSDSIYLIKHGEFEDIFSLNLIKRTINNCYKSLLECKKADFQIGCCMTKTLTDFHRQHNLGDYQKADFAKRLAENVKYKTDVTAEIVSIIDIIKQL